MSGDQGRGQDEADGAWSVRVTRTSDRSSKAYAGNRTFSVGKQAVFSREGEFPSAVEYLLGALGGDLLSGLAVQTAKRGIQLYGAEALITGFLDDPLAFLEVVGSKGSPGFRSISATVHVSSDAEEATMRQVWSAVLAISPLVNTLRRAVELSLHLEPTN